MKATRLRSSTGRVLTATFAVAILAAVPAAYASTQSPARLSASAAQQTPPPACPDGTGRTPLYRDTSYSFAERAADLVSWMTLSEKVQQLHTNNAPAIPRLGVQQYTYWSEGQHGVNSLGADYQQRRGQRRRARD